MPIHPTTSERIACLRFPMVLCIMLIHAAGMTHTAEGASISLFIENLFSQVIGRNAVPFFFITSAYLFFSKLPERNGHYRALLAQKLSTLFVPFILWSLLNMAVFWTLQSIPSLSHFFSGNNQRVADYSLYDFVNHLIGLEQHPIGYHLWFLRDLLKCFLLYPLFGWLARRIPHITLAILGILWLAEVPSMPVFYFFEIPFSFFLGAYFAIRKTNLEALDQHRIPIMLLYTIVSISVASYLTYASDAYCLTRGSVLVGIPAFWTVWKGVSNAWKQRWMQTSGYAFFVYLAHEPLLWGMKKLVWQAFPTTNNALTLVYYFGLVGVIAAVCLISAMVLKRYMHGLYEVITGKRYGYSRSK